MQRYFIELEDPDLAYFVEGTPEFDAYIADMLWAQDYALRQPRADDGPRRSARSIDVARPPVDATSSTVNCHHNYTQREHHHGRDLWVTRKGAIRAGVGDLGIIPGSMGTRHLHRAGARQRRVVHVVLARRGPPDVARRGAAHASPTDELARRDGGQGVERRRGQDAARRGARARTRTSTDVMATQADLVEVQHTLRQVLNYKGT